MRVWQQVTAGPMAMVMKMVMVYRTAVTSVRVRLVAFRSMPMDAHLSLPWLKK
ncbi:hypothetical protein D3C80_2173710 [compost metagenome]